MIHILSWLFILIVISFINISISAPHHHLTRTSTNSSNHYDTEQYDTIYDEKQNGIENIRFNIDRASLVWTSNSLLGLAALLEPALYDNGDDKPENNHFEIHLGPEEHDDHLDDIIATTTDKKNETTDKIENNTNNNEKQSKSTDDSVILEKRDGDRLLMNQSGKYRFPQLIRTLLVPNSRVS